MKFKSQKGVASYLSLMIMTVLLAMVLGLSAIFIDQVRIMRGMGHSVIAFHAANTGIERALMDRRNPIDIPETLLPNGAKYKVSVIDGGIDGCHSAPNLCIDSIGIYQGTKRAIRITYQLPAPAPPGPAWLAGWQHRQRITINHLNVGGDLTNFPVLVRLTAAKFDFTRARSDGFDIRFTATDGITLLQYERERHDNVGLRAEYWVRIPAVSGAVNTEFYIYYGNAAAVDEANPTAVWDVNTMARWGLGEAGTGAVGEFRDSTVNVNHGQGGGGTAAAVPTRVEGRIAQAQNFDGVNDFVRVPDSASFNMVNQITMGGWLFWDGGDIWHWNNVFVKRFHHQVGSEHFSLFLHRVGRFAHYCSVIGGVRDCLNSPHHSIPINQWFHIIITYDGSHQRIFINGVQAAVVARTGLMTANHEPFIMGGYIQDGNVDHFSGSIDEVRIYNRAVSAAWIRASFHSGNDTLLTYGARETQ